MQAKGAETIAKAAAATGARMVHVSAIGADENSLSAYGRAKAAGEQAVLAAVPSATILRPSLLFGPEDQFTNRFAALARISPFLPLIGGGVTRMQPVYVGDVATRGGRCRRRQDQARRDLRARRTGSADHARDHGNHSCDHRAQAACWFRCRSGWRGCRRCSCNSRRAPLKLTPDQVAMLQSDNVVSDAAKAAGLTLEGLGITPDSLEAIAPQYLWRFRAAGQFQRKSA